MSPGHRLGAFELIGRLGGGGMGEVWEGRDAAGLPVALKVITSRRAQKEKYRAAFRNEVRAMASLHHRGIVMVFDYGQASEDIWLEDTKLQRGSPFLAMELASDSLNHLPPLNTWKEVRKVLRETLEALAHAHARGVIHRDIKPPNILLSQTERQPNYKLADFGLAHAADSHGSDEITKTTTGTPRFMSPEQILGRWRDQGPWTDLYSLGCVAFWLTTGSTPFSGEDNDEIFRAHLTKAVPTFEPRLALPSGFELWLQGMLAKDPIDRYRRAADALHDLERLDEDQLLAPMSNARLDESSQPTVMDTFTPTSSATHALRDPTTREARGDSDPTLALDDAPWFDVVLEDQSSRPDRNRPPFPESWEQDETPAPSIALLGAGIGLFGLRPAPLVGRERERDRLWEMLRAVDQTEAPRCVIVSGRSGAGKSRIVEWIAQRAHEMGVVNIMKATHSPIGGDLDGVVGMLTDFCRTRGLNRTRTVKRLERLMSDDGKGRSFNVIDVASMVEILRPRDAEGTGWAQNVRESERDAVLESFLEQVGGERPLLIWFDDAQWGARSLRLARRILEDGTLPALVICTVRDDVEIPESAGDALAGLRDRLETVEIEVETLGAQAHAELVRRILRLDSELTQQVVERTQGNPLFAIQLIGDWIDRGILEVGTEGFQLSDGADAEIPDSIHNVWLGRLFTVFHRIERRNNEPEDRRDALASIELASVLGRDVESSEWTFACERAGLEYPRSLIEELAASRLVTLRDAGFTFNHTLLCESLARSARDHGRFRQHHATCADAIAELYRGTPGSHIRIAEHLLRAEEYDRAMAPLLKAAEVKAQRGEFLGALELDSMRDEAADLAGLPEDHRMRAHGWIRRARTMMLRGEIPEAASHIQRAEEIISEDDLESWAMLLWAQATLARHRSNTAQGIDLAEEAKQAYSQLGDQIGVARCHKKLGEFHRRQGNLERSVEHYERAMETFQTEQNDFEIAWTSLGLGATLRQMGRLESALINISNAQQTFERIGSSVGLGGAYNEMGEIERFMGRYENAEEHYRKVLAYWGRQRHVELDIIRYNIALSKLHREEYAQARDILEEIHESAVRGSNTGLRVFFCAGLVEAEAGLGNQIEAMEHLGRFRRALKISPLVDTDIATCMTDAGELAAAAGFRDLAIHCWQIAITQWKQLDRVELADQVQERLGSLPV